MACEAHDIRLGEIRKSPGREQSARVLLSARLRSINIKKLANIDGVAQDERITRAIMPSKIQLVRVNLDAPRLPDVFTDARNISGLMIRSMDGRKRRE